MYLIVFCEFHDKSSLHLEQRAVIVSLSFLQQATEYRIAAYLFMSVFTFFTPTYQFSFNRNGVLVVEIFVAKSRHRKIL